jgi:protein-tyrosine phosphatase
MALIQWIDQSQAGALGVMARPAKQNALESDLRRAKDEGVDVIVNLLTREERAKYQLEGEPAVAESLGIEYKSFPIENRAVPAANGETLAFLRARRKDMQQGRSVVFHCSSGRGRTGLMAASMLVLGGVDPDEAMKKVRGHRLTPVPDTKEQMEWVRNLARNMGMQVHPRNGNGKSIAMAALGVAVLGFMAWRMKARRS